MWKQLCCRKTDIRSTTTRFANNRRWTCNSGQDFIIVKVCVCSKIQQVGGKKNKNNIFVFVATVLMILVWNRPTITWCLCLMLYICHCCFFVLTHGFVFTESLSRATVEARRTVVPEAYGTTVPLQLVGHEWKPVSLLMSQVRRNTWTPVGNKTKQRRVSVHACTHACGQLDVAGQYLLLAN